MAKSKAGDDVGSDAQKQMEGARRYFDSIWRQKYDCAMHDWIVNMAKTPQHLRLLACFATPNVCELRGKMLVFEDNLLGRQAQELWKSNFITTLQDLGLSIYKEPEEKSVSWFDMNDKQKLGFAKAIWIKRDFVGREIRGMDKSHFEPQIQSMLCRMANAPEPIAMKNILESAGINIETLGA